jgi:response regulator NasT
MDDLVRGENMSKKLNVLICEDDYLVSQGLKYSIESLGHDVIAIAKNGKEAIELALEKLPDLIIMDINMPIVSGLVALEKINKYIDVPCIILTAYHKDSLIKKASENGALYYLIKPVTDYDLNAAINIVMARHSEFENLKSELNQTKEKLETRKYIEIAKGLLMDKYGIKEQEAMAKMQKISRDKNIKIVDVSKQIIELLKNKENSGTNL